MALEIVDLSKSFGRIRALDHISLDIQDGSLACFLGPSGCGKTTLLRVIAGLDSSDRGDIRLGGGSLSATPPMKRNFGVVFQSYSLFPNLTAIKNVMYGLECKGWDKARARSRALEMLDLVHLADQAGKLPTQMSGGQQQRVAIARALAPEPSLLLLDEPLSALDASVRAELRREIKTIQRDIGITTIMVTHDQEEALEMADQIVVLRGGKVEQVGMPHEIYHQPKTEFVANFIGKINSLRVSRGASGAPMFGGEVLCEGISLKRDAVMGLRPEAISLSTKPAQMDVSIRSSVSSVRFLGNISAVEITPECAPDQTLLVELHGAENIPKTGDTVFANCKATDLRELQQ